MSKTLDVNVLVYATDTGSPFHDRAKALVKQFTAGPGLVYLLRGHHGARPVRVNPGASGSPSDRAAAAAHRRRSVRGRLS